jgi:5-formyltetrahydrofolate cyclo-ligase
MNKDELREKYLQRRCTLSENERNMADNEICRLLSILPELKRAERLVAYVSDGLEPNLMPLLQQFAVEGKRIFLPRFAATSRAGYEMVETPLLATSLVTGRYGIAEPAADLPATNEDLSTAIWLVPGVAFDSSGNRLGRGKGIYDRLLAQAKAMAVGIFYKCQQTIVVPTDEHDYSLNIIITEAGITRLNNGV